uniref:Uncharacterized protein n=1 Tax=Rhizophora mucronata TaxID=61149 RepID=A0A2P2QI63_RHIMU
MPLQLVETFFSSAFTPQFFFFFLKCFAQSM